MYRPITREDLARIVPYTPPGLLDHLIDNNVTEGLVSLDDTTLALTNYGREAAEATVVVQEAVVERLWASVPDRVAALRGVLAAVVSYGRGIDPPMTPSAFALFASCCERPTDAATALRLITAVRYWRADAHRRALAEAGMRPLEAHALNRLWDVQRGVDRVGQGNPRPGRDGVAALEASGLAADAEITADGVALRQSIESNTDALTAPIYGSLDDASYEQLSIALEALPT
jgi:hypothetical protein